MTKKPTPPAAPVFVRMRLTNELRQRFVAAVMADVPEVDYAERVRDAVNKAHAAALPKPVRELLRSPETQEWVRTRYITLASYGKGPSRLPPGCHLSFTLAAPTEEWLQTLIDSVVAEHVEAWHAQAEQRSALAESLKTVAFTCNTPVQLAEALPEFAKYLPKASAPTSNLPATDNLVKDFMAAGWPKGKGGV